ncbi:MAG: hypothetical protein ACE5IZ_05910 [Dehalococcoidia bacterium]
MAVGRANQGTDVLGRVMEASIARLSAECYQLDGAPPLGGLVLVEEPRGDIYAVVCDAQTDSIEPGRRPVAHTPPEADAEAVLADNPQLRLLLRTTFDALVVGYEADGVVRQHLPPAPARIYARVRLCPPPQVRRLTESLHFLKLLLAAGPAADEVTAACLRQAAAVHPDAKAFLVQAGRALLGLVGQDPNHLTAILRSIQP